MKETKPMVVWSLPKNVAAREIIINAKDFLSPVGKIVYAIAPLFYKCIGCERKKGKTTVRVMRRLFAKGFHEINLPDRFMLPAGKKKNK